MANFGGSRSRLQKHSVPPCAVGSLERKMLLPTHLVRTNTSKYDKAMRGAVKLSEAEVKHVASLAKLDLTSDEVKKFKKQLGEVLDYMEELQEVDVAEATATSQTTGLTNVFREDEVEPTRGLKQDEALAGTEKTHNGYFMVSALLNKGNE